MSSLAKNTRDELSLEEADSLRRTNKKVKTTSEEKIISTPTLTPQAPQTKNNQQADSQTQTQDTTPTWKVSFKDTLFGKHDVEEEEQDICYDDDDWDFDDDDEEEEEGCPIIRISKEEYAAMCKPWKDALVIKVMGRKLLYTTIAKRI